ncbi:hypothetical protein MHI37_15055 [Paenibacillus sp. FSL H8-0548]|nr:hypothetical protein [Paenibacillus sp. FSL H8-0548]
MASVSVSVLDFVPAAAVAVALDAAADVRDVEAALDVAVVPAAASQ